MPRDKGEDMLSLVTDDLRDRYQHQPWYIRLWRRRWYLMIPWYAWGFRKITDFPAWSIAKAVAQGKMGWYYTMDEVFGERGGYDDDTMGT